MKMPDGGFRPAYDDDLATDADSQVIVGVAVTNQGTDQGEGQIGLFTVTHRLRITEAD